MGPRRCVGPRGCVGLRGCMGPRRCVGPRECVGLRGCMGPRGCVGLRGCMGPRECIGLRGGLNALRKSLFPLLNRTRGCPAHSIVTIPTEISWLPFPRLLYLNLYLGRNDIIVVNLKGDTPRLLVILKQKVNCLSVDKNLYLYKNINPATCFGYLTSHHHAVCR